jgi:hypothetical protein
LLLPLFKQFQYYTKNEEENITETNKRKQKKGNKRKQKKGNKQSKNIEEKKEKNKLFYYVKSVGRIVIFSNYVSILTKQRSNLNQQDQSCQ